MVDRLPEGIQEILEDLEAKDERKFELRRNKLRRRIDLLLDKKGEADKSGYRSTQEVEIKSKGKRYAFWVTEESPSPLQKPDTYGTDFLIMVRPIEIGETEVVVAYKIGARSITDILGYELHDDEDFDLIAPIESVISYLDGKLPVIKDEPSDGKRKRLRPVRTKSDSAS